MREGTRNFLVGLSSIIGLLGLAWLLWRFGEFDPWVNPKYAITIATTNASGLREGGAVELNGVAIGSITRVWSEEDAQYPVRVQAHIHEHVSVPTNVEMRVASSLLGAGARVQLTSRPHEGGQVTYYPKDGSALLPGSFSGGMMDDLTEILDERMKPLLDALASFEQLASTYDELGRNLNEMVRVQEEAELASGESPNLRTATRNLGKAIDDAAATFTLARKWLEDEQLRANVQASVENARLLIEKATAAVDQYTHLAASIETDAARVTQELVDAADAMSATLESVRRVTTTAIEGDGTVARMLNNPDLYNSLTDAAVRLERTLAEVQLLIQKIKAEGLPIEF